MKQATNQPSEQAQQASFLYSQKVNKYKNSH